MVGVGINAYFFSGESFSPFIDNANAKIELNDPKCPGFSEESEDTQYIITKCGCETARGEGLVHCDDDGGPTDPGEDPNP